MAFTVRQLIGANKEVITVLNTDSVKKAQNIMVEHQFSQLPVVDEGGKALGLITSDSILRALNTFGVSIDKLRVLDAMDEIRRTFRDEDDLFYLLDEVMNNNAVLVVDNERKLTGVVTSYDITEYFRQRAEDMMYAEDIETMLKDFINAYFSQGTDEINEVERNRAITAIMPSNHDDLKKFQKALMLYMQLQGSSDFKPKQDLVEQAFAQHLYRKEPSKPFEQLTQNHYIDLFLHEDRWDYYSSIFSFDRKKIRSFLDDARRTRNDAAHFRSEEITSDQRERLKTCRDWLARHEDAVHKAFSKDIAKQKDQLTASTLTTSIRVVVSEEPLHPTEEVHFLGSYAQLDEELNSNDSRYTRLALWLQKEPLDEESVSLTFRQIEDIIGDELPKSAHQHRSWWANDSVSHIQSQQWLEAGWRVSGVNIVEERVTFTRIKDREKVYNNFFSTLHEKISQQAQLETKPYTPNNRSYMTIGYIQGYAYFGFAFTYRKRFRVELYINAGNAQKSKDFFDKLFAHKNTIELEVGAELSWERLEGKQTARIAYYHDGSITDDSDTLAQLREWAVEVMLRFQPVMEKYVSEVYGGAG